MTRTEAYQLRDFMRRGHWRGSLEIFHVADDDYVLTVGVGDSRYVPIHRLMSIGDVEQIVAESIDNDTTFIDKT